MKLDELLDMTAPYSGLKRAELRTLHGIVSGFALPAGAVVQCGVVNGGSAVLLWHACGGGERDLWMLDSWEGLPEPKPQDGPRARSKYDYRMKVHGHWCKGDMEKAREIARIGGVPEARTHLVKGLFFDTLPDVRRSVGPIAMLHLDADWYKSTSDCLIYLYPRLAPGALLVLDDYNIWPGVKTACVEYGIDGLLTKTEPTGAYLVKEAEQWRMPQQQN